MAWLEEADLPANQKIAQRRKESATIDAFSFLLPISSTQFVEFRLRQQIRGVDPETAVAGSERAVGRSVAYVGRRGTYARHTIAIMR